VRILAALTSLTVSKRLSGATLLVFANKTDVNGCLDEADIRKVLRKMSSKIKATLTLYPQGLQLDAIKTHKWHIIQCSAITGKNLDEGLEWVVQDAKERLFLY
jgi:ADP-ribosylation factor-like protein 2